ncbi:hypothetical protein TNIN_444891 [Trichonephila inaurata madagascariensis]|uniref:Uncharacterized protein n=1 Tax=Trichonephila inaurata madagascariensis TaxID=2747483 RepID=A0A8X7CUG8_9ARAC|nr:hypothetical protein TNIN_444891 [Trichonephila inaurata madagascariensis]
MDTLKVEYGYGHGVDHRLVIENERPLLFEFDAQIVIFCHRPPTYSVMSVEVDNDLSLLTVSTRLVAKSARKEGHRGLSIENKHPLLSGLDVPNAVFLASATHSFCDDVR